MKRRMEADPVAVGGSKLCRRGVLRRPASSVNPGEKILNSACTTCHELRPIETNGPGQGRLDKSRRCMVEKGADVKKDDVPVLVRYLVSIYGPLPEGPGKAVLLNICTQCHTLERVKVRGGDRQSWDDLLSHMLNEGAPSD